MNIEHLKNELELIEFALREKASSLKDINPIALPIAMKAYLNMAANTIEQIRKEIL